MKTKLEKLKRLFSLYKIKYQSKIIEDEFEFIAETQYDITFASSHEINYHKSINAMGFDMTLIEYLELESFELAYKSFRQNDAKVLLNKYLITLNKTDRKLLDKMIKL